MVGSTSILTQVVEYLLRVLSFLIRGSQITFICIVGLLIRLSVLNIYAGSPAYILMIVENSVFRYCSANGGLRYKGIVKRHSIKVISTSMKDSWSVSFLIVNCLKCLIYFLWSDINSRKGIERENKHPKSAEEYNGQNVSITIKFYHGDLSSKAHNILVRFSVAVDAYLQMHAHVPYIDSVVRLLRIVKYIIIL